MKLRRIGATIGVVAMIGTGLALASALPASAHDKTADVTCQSATVDLENYDAHATATVVLDGATLQDGEFGGHYVLNQALADQKDHSLQVTVRSNDGDQYNFDFDKTTTGCAPVAPPTKPADKVDVVTTEGSPDCTTSTVPIDTATTTTGWTLDEKTNTWIAAAPVTTHVTSTRPATVQECPLPPTVNKCAVITDGGKSTNLDANGWAPDDTRTGGHTEYVDGGLHIWTDSNTSADKVDGYHALNVALADVGIPAFDYTNNSGGAPGLQIILASGQKLVNEGDIYGAGEYWSNTATPGVNAGAGYNALGTLDQYLAALPDAQVVAVGFSLGSGVQGDNTIHSITAGCVTYTFGYQAPPVIVPDKPAPVVATTVAIQKDCPNTEVLTTTTTTTTDWVLDEAANVWTEGKSVVTTSQDYSVATAEQCPAVVVPPAVTVTPRAATVSAAGLADTGVDAPTFLIGVGGIVILCGVIILIAYKRRGHAGVINNDEEK